MKSAIILNGLVRVPNPVALDKTLTRANRANADVFVVTNTSEASKLDHLRLKIDRLHVAYVEDDASALESEIVYKSKGMVLMRQWIKYILALKKLREYELRCNSCYDLIYRMRTDVNYISDEDLDSVSVYNRLGSSLGLYANTEVSFGGKRESMMLLGRFEEFFLNTYLRSNTCSLPVNISQLSASSVSFKFTSFPIIVRSVSESSQEWVSKVERILSHINSLKAQKKQYLVLEYLKKVAIEQHEGLTPGDHLRLCDDKVLYISLEADFLTYSEESIDNSVAVNFFRGNLACPSEVIFARFVNLYGITIYSPGPLEGSLIPDRKTYEKSKGH
jgi:hypothetical protein